MKLINLTKRFGWVFVMTTMLLASGIAILTLPNIVPVANKRGNSNVFALASTNSAASAGTVYCDDGSGNLTAAGCNPSSGAGFVVYSNLIGLPLTGTIFIPAGGATASTTEANVQSLVESGTTFSNFGASLSVALGTGASVVFTWRKNGSSQTLTCTISNPATTCSDTTHSFTTSAGNLVNLQAVFAGTVTSVPVFNLITQVGTFSSSGVASVFGQTGTVNIPVTTTDISTPSNPGSGNTTWYTKGGKLCALNPSGVETCTGGTSAVTSVFGQTGAVDIPVTTADILTPGNPASGHTTWYSKGGVLCALNSLGTETCTGGGGGVSHQVYLVQQASACGTASTAFQVSNTVGSLLVAGFATDTTPSSVSDGTNTWTMVNSVNNAEEVSLWYAPNSSSSLLTVTATGGGGGSSANCIGIFEFLGVQSVVDTSTTATNSNVASLTTTVASDLIVSAMGGFSNGSSLNQFLPTFLANSNGGDGNLGTGYYFAGAAGQWTGSIASSDGRRAMVVAAFKAQ